MYEKRVLPNGVRILTEAVPAVRSATVGIWVGSGSRHEKAAENGAAHFIEHMVFKGTANRTAAQLAQEMDAVGGQVNAYTTKECTCFYAHVLDAHLPRTVDLLCDMLFSSRFDEADVETERGVILEEIGMYQDTPDDLCAERLSAGVYRGSSLARPILGRPSTLKKMSGAFLKDYMARRYLPGDMVIALAGSFTHRDVDHLAARFSALPAGALPPLKPASYHPTVTVKKKAIEQNHLTIAFPGLTFADPRRFALQLLSSALGGGMSSRLWQELREKQGLCYSIYSYGASHADVGLFAIYTALGKETEARALKTILHTVETFAEKGVTAQELDRAREQAKANVLMALESTQARASHLGRGELLTGGALTTDEVIAVYDAVTPDQVRDLAQALFDFSQLSLSAVGRVENVDYYRALLVR